MIPSARQPRSTDLASDETLVVRAQAGDVAAFETVMARIDGRLLNFIARRIGGRSARSDAEDIVQETFLRAWRNLQDFEPRHKFTTWLFTIASRLAVDHLRHRRVREDAADVLASSAASSDEAQTRVDRRSWAFGDDRGGLWSIAREMLTAEQHAALWLRYAEDLSPGEVARVLDKNEVAVRVMLHRARQALAPHAAQWLEGQQQAEGPRLRNAQPAATGGVA